MYTGDALDAVPDPAFDLILLNPPYQSDFSVAKKLILKSFNRLEMGGRLFLVVKRGTGISTNSKAFSAERAFALRTVILSLKPNAAAAATRKRKHFVTFVAAGLRVLRLTGCPGATKIDR